MRPLLVALLLILGCAHTPPTPPPLIGSRELRSPHVRLRTDFPEGAARETVEKLEQLRTWLQAAWSTEGDSPGTTNAVVLDGPAELSTFSHIPAIATTTRQGPIIVTAGSGNEFLFGDVRRARPEALVRQFPGNPEALVFRARVLRDDGGPVEGRREAALEAVVAAPDSVGALTAHAIEEVRAGDADAAFQSVERAEALQPWNPGVFVARAVLLAATGRCDEAADSVQRALDVLPDDPPPEDVRALVGERERIRASCRSRPRP